MASASSAGTLTTHGLHQVHAGLVDQIDDQPENLTLCLILICLLRVQNDISHPLSPLLFVLVMDCLARLFVVAQEAGILAPLGSLPIRHHKSIYSDDAVLFIRPELSEVRAAAALLKLFGEPTGLSLQSYQE